MESLTKLLLQLFIKTNVTAHETIRKNLIDELHSHSVWHDQEVLSISRTIQLLNERAVYKCSKNPGKLFNFKWCDHCKVATSLDLLLDGGEK